MTTARPRALVFLAVAALAVAAFGFAAIWRERVPRERPALLLLTSLPLLFNEDFSLKGGGSKALSALRKQYRLIPISVTDGPELAKGRLLLMAHPLAQTAENLVALDAWVRRGGRVLLLADPLLEWPSKRPFGDPLRPPPMFTDTGLLAHWGLQLDAPAATGAQQRNLGGYTVLTVSPGELSGSCAISADRFVARCQIGQGEAIVVADADFLDAEILGQAAEHNLDGLDAELAKLESK
jgi:hypothetical protein